MFFKSYPLFRMNLQDAASFLKEDMTFFHDYIMFFNIFITCLVFLLLIGILMSKMVNRFFLYSESVEFIWTLFPAMILLLLSLPSLAILYMSEISSEIQLTVKAIAHQWFWSYESHGLESNSSIIYDETSSTLFRSLDVDTRLVLPINTGIRMVTTSEDVIHSFSLPSLGVKMDSVPGRLNQMIFESSRSGVFFGQCSEICGVLHSFMPICVEMVGLDLFLSYLTNDN